MCSDIDDFDNDITVAEGQSGNLSTVLVNDGHVVQLIGCELGSGAVLTCLPGRGENRCGLHGCSELHPVAAGGHATVNVAANGSGTGRACARHDDDR
jgi:hypothetical protein